MPKNSYELEISEKAYKIFRRLKKGNINKLNIINNKIQQIIENPSHFKPLKGDLHGARRVHIDKSFVLTYEIRGNAVRILDYEHHDKIY